MEVARNIHSMEKKVPEHYIARAQSIVLPELNSTDEGISFQEPHIVRDP